MENRVCTHCRNLKFCFSDFRVYVLENLHMSKIPKLTKSIRQQYLWETRYNMEGMFSAPLVGQKTSRVPDEQTAAVVFKSDDLGRQQFYRVVDQVSMTGKPSEVGTRHLVCSFVLATSLPCPCPCVPERESIVAVLLSPPPEVHIYILGGHKVPPPRWAIKKRTFAYRSLLRVRHSFNQHCCNTHGRENCQCSCFTQHDV